ncbi:hypothetical protein GCM10011519_15440 [Marmoricola endophyticus]|uniref:Uncharacterized protein n=2 Tax=Marmoricola endophyticus TaxID=2040280 RepID=A0A917BHD5_9ACTN|nr:hypothetical protein GCM10011519_15440 [Marmoricola endophyticus]
MGASLSGLTATITNSTNTAASASMAITETSGSSTCKSYDTTATCADINKYGGTGTPLTPGGSQSTKVTFNNVGQVAVGTSTLTPAACTASSTGATGSSTPTTPNTSAGNLCSVLQVKIYQSASASGTPIYTGSAAGLTSAISLGKLAAGASQDYTFVVSLPADATTAVQGQSVSQALTWSFNQ